MLIIFNIIIIIYKNKKINEKNPYFILNKITTDYYWRKIKV